MTPLSIRRPATLVVCLLALSAASAGAQSAHRALHKIDRSLAESLQHGVATVDVIVTVDDPALRLEIRRSLVQHGDAVKADHPLIDAFAARIHSSDVAQLANHPGVRFISSDARVSAGSAPPADVPQNRALLRDDVQLSEGGIANALRSTLGLSSAATAGPTGEGVGVAVIDSGIAPNADFDGRISGFFDFTRGGIPTAPFDDYGHGTHVAGLIGSSGVLSNYQFQGVAPEARLVGLKVLDRTGQGSTSDVIKAIEYVVANHDLLGVQIVNLSIGHPIFSSAADDPLVQAVERASAQGLIVVASAGNVGQNPKTGTIGYGGITSPGNAPSAITVGAATTLDTAIRDDDSVAAYSSSGPSWYDATVKPDLVAPGNGLVSDSISSSYLYRALGGQSRVRGGAFLKLSGTSMAAGVTSGVVALVLDASLRSRYRGATPLTPNLVKAILQFSAIVVRDAAAAGPLTQGAGQINALGAITLGSAMDTSAHNGQGWLRNSVPAQTTIGGRAYSWSQTIIWGDAIVSGDVLFHASKAWARDVVWGNSRIWNDPVWRSHVQLEATNIIWGDVTAWASNIVWGDSRIGMMDGESIVWGSVLRDDNIVWGSLLREDNIVWGNLFEDNIVWGNLVGDDNIVWGNSIRDDNIVWGNAVAGATGGGF